MRLISSLILFLIVSLVHSQEQSCLQSFVALRQIEGPNGLELRLVEVDAETGTLEIISESEFPNSFNLTSTGLANGDYIVVQSISSSQSRLLLIDPESGVINEEFIIDGSISSIEYDESSNRIFFLQISSLSERILFELSLSDGSVNQVSQFNTRIHFSSSSGILNNQYFFIRRLFDRTLQLLYVDIETGDVARVINLINPMGDIATSDDISSFLDYDPATQSIYGLNVSGTGPSDFIRIDIGTGQITSISQFDLTNSFVSLGATGIAGGQFYFVEQNGDDISLNFINLADGSIVNSVPLSTPIFHLQAVEICEDIADTEIAAPIPTLSQWGLFFLSLLVMIISVVALRSDRGYIVG